MVRPDRHPDLAGPAGQGPRALPTARSDKGPTVRCGPEVTEVTRQETFIRLMPAKSDHVPRGRASWGSDHLNRRPLGQVESR
jgi:hypothetical protein